MQHMVLAHSLAAKSICEAGLQPCLQPLSQDHVHIVQSINTYAFGSPRFKYGLWAHVMLASR